jgi:hypothetical protein
MFKISLKKNVVLECCMLFLVLLPFVKVFSEGKVTGWDTFDIYTVNFLYFCDSLQNFVIPLWNPFTLSGNSFIENLFTVQFFGPIDFILGFLSFLFPPIWLAEFSIILGVLLTYLGNKKLLSSLGADNFSSFNGAFLASVIFLAPITGQISFIYSFALLPWILFFILQKENNFIFFKSLFLTAIFIKGYFYFNAIILIIAFSIYIINTKYKNIIFNKKLLLFIMPLSLFALSIGPAFVNYTSIYSDLLGPLKIEEPRIRPLISMDQYFIGNLFKTLSSLLFGGGTWTLGLHYFSIPFIVILFLKIKMSYKKTIQNKHILYALIILFLAGVFFSSSEKGAKVILNLFPISSSHRWHFTNIYFSIWASAIIIGLPLFSNHSKKINWLINKVQLFTFATAIFTSFFFYYRNDIFTFFEKEYHHREKNIFYTQNTRSLGNSKFFLYDNHLWLTEKKPMSHGYNNTSSIYYWYMKDMPFLERIISSNCNFLLAKKKQRSDFANDNDYINYQIDQISPQGNYVLLKESLQLDLLSKCSLLTIDNFKLAPNELEFNITANEQGFVQLNTQDAPGWKAYLNDKEVPIVKTNLIFQGLEIPKGQYKAKLIYRPTTFYLLMTWYFAIFCFIGFSLLIPISVWFSSARNETE